MWLKALDPDIREARDKKFKENFEAYKPDPETGISTVIPALADGTGVRTTDTLIWNATTIEFMQSKNGDPTRRLYDCMTLLAHAATLPRAWPKLVEFAWDLEKKAEELIALESKPSGESKGTPESIQDSFIEEITRPIP